MPPFRLMDRDTGYLFPPSVDDWLPPEHMARFVVEVIDGLDLSAFSKRYRGTGSVPYHPALLLGILVYGYATGVFSSRKLERATYDSVAFRFVASNQHPDHDTIATFRRRFLPEIEALFVQVLLLAREMGYTGVALKACKGQSDSLILAAAGQKFGMFMCVQDLTCPGFSFLHSASLAARIPGIAAIEGNGRQYCPAANRRWKVQYPPMFDIKDGTVGTAVLDGVGLGF